MEREQHFGYTVGVLAEQFPADRTPDCVILTRFEAVVGATLLMHPRYAGDFLTMLLNAISEKKIFPADLVCEAAVLGMLRAVVIFKMKLDPAVIPLRHIDLSESIPDFYRLGGNVGPRSDGHLSNLIASVVDIWQGFDFSRDLVRNFSEHHISEYKKPGQWFLDNFCIKAFSKLPLPKKMKAMNTIL